MQYKLLVIENMSLSDDELLQEEEAEDKKMADLWTKKVRRQSSGLKLLVGDRLQLKENPKITMVLAKNGEEFNDDDYKI